MTTASYAHQVPVMEWGDDTASEREDLAAFARSWQDQPVAELIGTESMPTWFPRLVDQLNDVLSLDDGWAGPGSLAPNEHSALSALRSLRGLADPYLRPPQLVPTVDGGVQIEWHTNGVDLELCFGSAGEVDVYIADEARHLEEAGAFAELFDEIRLALKALTQ